LPIAIIEVRKNGAADYRGVEDTDVNHGLGNRQNTSVPN
jgi:hypothetical protein